MLSLAPIVFKNWPRWSAKVSLNFCWVDDIKTLFRGNLCLPVHVFVDEKEREREKDQFKCLVYKTIRKFFNAQHSETCSEHLNGWCIWINSLTKEGTIGENTVRRIHIMLRGFREEHLTGLQITLPTYHLRRKAWVKHCWNRLDVGTYFGGHFPPYFVA